MKSPLIPALHFAVEDPRPNEQPPPSESPEHETFLEHDTDPSELSDTRQTPAAPYATHAQFAELLFEMKAMREQAAKDSRAAYEFAANLGLKVDSLQKQAEHNGNESRTARSAAVLAADKCEAVFKMIDEKVMSGLAEIDRKIDVLATGLKGELDAVATSVVDLTSVAEQQGLTLNKILKVDQRLYDLEKASTDADEGDRPTHAEYAGE